MRVTDPERAAEIRREFDNLSRRARGLGPLPVARRTDLAPPPKKRLGKLPGTGNGGGGAKLEPTTPGPELIRDLRERLQLMKLEVGVLNETTEAAARRREAEVRLRAAFERGRLERDLKQQLADKNIKITAAEAEQIRQLGAAIEAETIAIAANEEAQKKATKAKEAADEANRKLVDGLQEISDTFVDAITQADSFADALKRIGVQLAEMAAKGLFTGKGPLGGLFNSVLGSGGGLLGLLGGGGISTASTFGGLFNAKGNVFQGGNVVPFAKGGIVNGPTTFPMRGGVGLMGEAGPEAIIPLTRGRGGKLGIEAPGGAGGGITIIQHNNFGGMTNSDMQAVNAQLRKSEARLMEAIPGRAAQGMQQNPRLRR